MIDLVYIIILSYGILIFLYLIGWRKTSKPSYRHENLSKISVIVSCRNEEKNITKLVKSLKQQTCPSDKIEFIFIDDHSDDNTLQLLFEEQKKSNNIIVLKQDEGIYGKKKAIIKGVDKSSGEIIITTDADCFFNKRWIDSITSYFSDENVKLVVGPVVFKESNSIWDSFQSLEFLSLIGSGAGSIGINQGIFCNGANFAYKKDLFIESNDILNSDLASGDDVFLMHYVKRKHPRGIVFAKNQDSIVTTYAKNTIQDFINQRKRWTAKSIDYKDASAILSSIIVLLTNIFIVLFMVLSFFDLQYLYYFLLFIASKFLVDFIFLIPVLRFFKRERLIKFIFPFELIYSFYIIFIVVISFMTSFTWKGRVYKK